jgi:two-component system chemotaxis response regulator CheB
MKLKVLIVDDSALMRRYLSEILEANLEVELQTARDGADALARTREWDPDVITLDVNMPVMDGLTCLAHLMTDLPRPVVMVSSLTERDAIATLEALAMGAVDFVTKPGGTVSLNIKQVGAELVAKVRAAGRQAKIKRLRRHVTSTAPAPAESRRPSTREPKAGLHVQPRAGAPKLVMIGVSTGGPSTLERILPRLPADFAAPVLVAQHMPANFTRLFAERLDSLCALRVEEVQRRAKLEPGRVYIARGDADVEVARLGVGLVACTVPEKGEYLWHPSVDHMVSTAAQHLEPAELVGVLLTGMGNDGATTMAGLHPRGMRTIAESEETAVIFGMPADLIERGGAQVVLPHDDIAAQLVEWVGRGGAEHGADQTRLG